MSKTAAGTFNFSLEFFSAVHTFEFPTEKPCCRLFLKPFLTVLKKTESMKQLENFVIDMDPNSETMVFRVQLRNGIKSLYKLPLTDVFANSMPSIIRRDDSSNTIVLMARQLLDAFEVAGKEGSEVIFGFYWKVSTFSTENHLHWFLWKNFENYFVQIFIRFLLKESLKF